MKYAKVILSTCLFLAASPLALAAEAPGLTAPTAEKSSRTVVVYKAPSCGCCDQWAEHMEAHGFAVESVLERDMTARKLALGVPSELWSCHTAVIDGFVIEGHVPAADVLRLLEERPKGTGLAVPGMPVGSPGMEYGGQRQAYDVVLFDRSGEPKRFEHYPAKP
jgi:hypothetical protein